MSQENVTAMNAAIEAFNRRDGAGFGALMARDAEIVPVRAALEGKGRGSGAAIDSKGGWLARFDDGLITSFQTFADRAAALEAVGLSE